LLKKVSVFTLTALVIQIPPCKCRHSSESNPVFTNLRYLCHLPEMLGYCSDWNAGWRSS